PVILCERQERERVVPAQGELDFHYAALPQGLGPHADEALLETCLDFRQLALGLECFGNAIIKRHLAVLEGPYHFLDEAALADFHRFGNLVGGRSNYLRILEDVRESLKIERKAVRTLALAYID